VSRRDPVDPCAFVESSCSAQKSSIPGTNDRKQPLLKMTLRIRSPRRTCCCNRVLSTSVPGHALSRSRQVDKLEVFGKVTGRWERTVRALPCNSECILCAPCILGCVCRCYTVNHMCIHQLANRSGEFRRMCLVIAHLMVELISFEPKL
jgi:hypothetical protein